VPLFTTGGLGLVILVLFTSLVRCLKNWERECLGPHGWGVADPRNTLLPRVTEPNLVGLRQTVWAYVRGTKNFGTLGPASLGLGRGWPSPLEIYVSPTCVTHAKFGHSKSNHSSVITEICQKKNWPFSRSFEVTDRSATYDFLLLFHSNEWPYLVQFPR